MKKAEAQLTIEVNVVCPECTTPFDLLKFDDDNEIINMVMADTWDGFIDFEVTCIKCKQEFLISGLEW